MQLAQNRKLTVLCLLLFLCWASAAAAATRVYFNPPLPGEQRVAAYIAEAINGVAPGGEILVQEYQFDEPSILQALMAAQKRGVRVCCLFDKTVGDAAETLKNAGITVGFDPVHIAHNKVLIIDRRLVIGGSFNLTVHANTHNCENCVFIDDPAVVRRFVQNFQARVKNVPLTVRFYNEMK